MAYAVLIPGMLAGRALPSASWQSPGGQQQACCPVLKNPADHVSWPVLRSYLSWFKGFFILLGIDLR